MSDLGDLAQALMVGNGSTAQLALQRLLGPGVKILAVGLFGSRGRALLGHNQVVTAASDIDGLVVLESHRLARQWKDRFRLSTGRGDLDLEVVSKRELSTQPKKLNDRFYWHPACVLLDDGGLLTNYFNELAKRVERGPEPWSAAERTRQLGWLQRMLRRIKLNRQQSSLAGYQLCFLKSELLLLARPARGLWGMGPRSTLAWLESDFPQVAQLWSDALEAPSHRSVDEELETLEKLVEWTVRGPGTEGSEGRGANPSP